MTDHDSPKTGTCTTGPPRLELTLTSDGHQCTVTMIGTLDESSTPAVDTQYDQLVGAGFDEVVLDVRGLRRVDESGAVALAQLWARLRNCGVFCRIRGLAPSFADSPIELLLSIRGSGTQMLPALWYDGPDSPDGRHEVGFDRAPIRE
jgi:anti-anti-sigma regulatory factor